MLAIENVPEFRCKCVNIMPGLNWNVIKKPFFVVWVWFRFLAILDITIAIFIIQLISFHYLCDF